MINNLLFDTEPYLKPTCFMEMIHKISAHAEAGRMGASFNSTVAIAPKFQGYMCRTICVQIIG